MKRADFAILAVFLTMFAGCADSTYPFDEVTDEFTFTYNLPADGIVDVIVLNCYMNIVRTLVSAESQTSGDYSLSWDLNDGDGSRVPDGLYYIRIKLDGNVIETKMYEVHK